MPGLSLASGAAFFSPVVIGPYAYALGAGIGVNSIQRATIHVDGSMDSFVTIPGLILSNEPTEVATAVIGNYLYVIGGDANGTMQRATINADGSLGSFAGVSATGLKSTSADTASIVGNFLYIVGGNGALPDVEQATINADGSLGTFMTVGQLATGRYLHTSAIVDHTLCIFGGQSASGDLLSSIECGELTSLPPVFSAISNISITARYGGTSAVAGGTLYVIGGGGNGIAPPVEQTTVDTEGNLETFKSNPGVSLNNPLLAPGTIVLQNNLYVIGGYFKPADTTSIESAQLQ